MAYYTATDKRGIWALFRYEPPFVYQYRAQHKRWDEAPWWYGAFMGFGDVQERRELDGITEKRAAELIENPPQSLVVYEDNEWEWMGSRE